ncbi:MAG: hypothetical protein P4L50_07405 [Anaerolineaceae bacterium]|nr:hypothetical protein [Anaerolineaceae bacterium]
MNNGGLVTIALLLPNLLWVLFPSKSKTSGETNLTNPPNLELQILERIGQFGCFLLPFFYNLHIQTGSDRIFFVLLLAALLTYYTVWLRYFIKGRKQVWMYRNLGPLPLPLTICPLLCFLLASILFQSILLAAAVVIFGSGHIYNGIIERKQAEQLYSSNESALGSKKQ